MKKGNRKLEEEKNRERVEEERRKRRVSEEQLWPAIRPPIKGIRRILTTPGGSRTPTMIDRRGMDPTIAQETNVLITATTDEILGTFDEPRKRKEKQINNEAEIEELNNQIKILAEEREKLRERRTPYKGKPRIISNVQVVPLRGEVQEIIAQEKQMDGDWTRVTRRREEGRRAEADRRDREKRKRSRSENRQRRLPRAAVRAQNENVSYAEVLR